MLHSKDHRSNAVLSADLLYKGARMTSEPSVYLWTARRSHLKYNMSDEIPTECLEADLLETARRLVITEGASVVVSWINDVYLPCYCEGTICIGGKGQVVEAAFDYIWKNLEEDAFSAIYAVVRNTLGGPGEDEYFEAACDAIDDVCDDPEEAKLNIKMYLLNNLEFYDIVCEYCDNKPVTQC